MFFSRRELLRFFGQSGLAIGCAPISSAFMRQTLPLGSKSMRCINVINFIRGVEPREQMDLLLPVQKQMEVIKQYRLPATWLIQYDALVSGSFVAELKGSMPSDHEVGFWFEMNEMLVKDAGVEWRGRPNFEWDSHPSVAFSIGYTEDERKKLVDAAMHRFREIWGQTPKSVASWNLDAISMQHMTERYGIDAYAVCRDQIATDGFTIWGAPIAGYFPSKLNCWSPALSHHNQIATPVLRMLGQDPVYYYNNRYPLPDGSYVQQPDTMEPVWTSGRSHSFVKDFLEMIGESPTLDFAYAQLGQENSFGWPEMAEAYPMQMEALARLRENKTVHVETMGNTGRRFKGAFSSTPVQAQIMLEDPYGNSKPAEKTIWYQSKFYRANLHFKGDLPFIRDLTVYSDRHPQPYLTTATRDSDVEQRMPAVLDGYHWSAEPGRLEHPGAGVFFQVAGERLLLGGDPTVREEGNSLIASLPLQGGLSLEVRFDEREISFHLSGKAAMNLALEWDPSKGPKLEVHPERVVYTWQGFEYAVRVKHGRAMATPSGWSVEPEGKGLTLALAQAS